MNKKLFLSKLLSSILFFLGIRTFSTLSMLLFWGQRWGYKMFLGVIPVISLNIDPVLYTRINSYSAAATSIAMLLYMLWTLRKLDPKSDTIDQRALLLAALGGNFISLMQYLIALALNYQIYFSINIQVAAIVIPAFLISAALFAQKYFAIKEQ